MYMYIHTCYVLRESECECGKMYIDTATPIPYGWMFVDLGGS